MRVGPHLNTRMRAHDFIENLYEVEHRDNWPLIEILRQHQGKNRFVHFTKMSGGNNQRSPLIPKMGINPKPNSFYAKDGQPSRNHNDPEGIYLYPVDYLLGDDERVAAGTQFATNYPAWFICELSPAAHGIIASNTTSQEIDALANRNGWYEGWKEVEAGEDSKEHVYGMRKNSTNVVMRAYDYLDYCQRNKVMTWMSALRGVDYIYDDGFGMFHVREPDQLCVMNTRMIKIINSGIQVDTGHDKDKVAYWYPMVKKLFADLKTRLGGDIKWKDKEPSFSATVQGVSFTIEFNKPTSSFGLRLSYKWLRADESQLYVLRKWDRADDILNDIVKRINGAIDSNSKGEDIFFQPLLPDRQLKALFDTLCDSSQMNIEDRVYNGLDYEDETEKNGTHTLDGIKNVNSGDMVLKMDVRTGTNHKEAYVRIEAMMGRELVLTAFSKGGFDDIINDLPPKIEQWLDEYIPSKYPESTSYRRFTSIEEAHLFVGWFLVSLGMSPVILTPKLKEYRNQWVAYPKKDKLEYNFKWAFRP